MQNGERVIAYKMSGHFGAESVIANLVAKVKIISFRNVIKKKISHLWLYLFDAIYNGVSDTK